MEEILSQAELSIRISSTSSRPDSFVEAVHDDHLIFIGEAHNIPKSTKAGTEDAYFFTDKGVGVSDGVGGWNQYGIDCSLFSSTLMKEC